MESLVHCQEGLFALSTTKSNFTPTFLSISPQQKKSFASASSGAKELQQQQYLRSPDLVALEYADLNLTHKISEVPVEVPDWNQVFRDPTLPLMLVKRAEFWVKDLSLSNIYFMFANATTSFQQLVSTYPGPLMLVSILCPDPYFKKRHHKRRVVQKPLVDSIVSNLMPSGQKMALLVSNPDAAGQVFLQSDVLEVALDMRNQFDSQPQVLKHIHEIDSSVLCDSEGWVLSNPMGIRTEREIHAEFEGAKIYRRIYQKQIKLLGRNSTSAVQQLGVVWYGGLSWTGLNPRTVLD
ncbi:tRNA (guanine-N-7) methyltransferase [Prunus dulcis]|uniref:tRNA (guanine(46)-N(7))-methyltransferase n=1 Tax=Prunus dulcis TaxID=3755 RepID=A0A4Y1QZ22_PRUDU|nr:tRNA (guanine-N-7) methyltransferase [Prunus dulcis]